MSHQLVSVRSRQTNKEMQRGSGFGSIVGPASPRKFDRLCHAYCEAEGTCTTFTQRRRIHHNGDVQTLQKMLSAEQNMLAQEQKRSRELAAQLDQTRRLLPARVQQVHRKARGKHPLYPERLNVSDAATPWTENWEEYEPVEYTAGVRSLNCAY